MPPAQAETEDPPLREGDRHPPDADGVPRSIAFPGLWLDIAAALAMDTTGILATLQLGLKNREHAAFVASLRARTP